MTRRSKPKRKARGKGGRPSLGAAAKSVPVMIRLTLAERFALDQLALDADTTSSGWARDAVLVALESAAAVVAPPPPEGEDRTIEAAPTPSDPITP